MNENEKIEKLEETIRLKDKEIYDVKTSVAEVLEKIHELNEKNEDEVLRKQIAELCTNTRYELLIDETKNRKRKNLYIRGDKRNL